MTRSTRTILIIAIIGIMASGIAFLALNRQDTSKPNTAANTSQQIKGAEVATHNSKASCWTIINNNVYDITNYIPQHPGGDEILQACGTDGSTLFNKRETSSGEEVGTGTAHSSQAARELASMQIGTLAP